MNLTISIVIPAYCKKDTLQRCLFAIGQQTYEHKLLEVIVVDDCLGDSLLPTVETFRKTCLDLEKVIFHRNPKNLGRAASRNAGLQYVTSSVILFLDVDNLLDVDCCKHLAKYFEGCSEKIAVRCDVQSSLEATKASSYVRFFDSRYLGRRSKSELKGLDLDRLPSKYFATDAVAVSYDAIAISNGFDENFSDYGCEDEDMGIRLTKSGFTFRFGFGCKVTDSDIPTIRRACERMTVYSSRSVPKLLRKHPGYVVQTLFSILERPVTELSIGERMKRELMLSAAYMPIARFVLAGLERVDRYRLPGLGLFYKYVLTSYYVAGMRIRAAL